MPLSNAEVFTLRFVAGAETEIASCCEAVVALVDESITCALKEKLPEAVGVPEIVPLPEFKVSPAGNAPEISVQLYGETPPLAASDALYGDDWTAAGIVVVTTAKGPGGVTVNVAELEVVVVVDVVAVVVWVESVDNE